MARRRRSRSDNDDNWLVSLVVFGVLFIVAPEKIRNEIVSAVVKQADLIFSRSILGSMTLPILAALVGLAFVLLLIKGISGLFLRTGNGAKSMSISDVDAMDPFEFEHYVASLLRFQGFRNIEVTKKSGDWGADIIAERERRKYTIQVKRWRNYVTERAVKEAVFAQGHYGCDGAMVITNSYFTGEAKHWARHYDCALIDRDTLIRWKRQAEKGITAVTA